mmetsp:Transcript_19741/g.43779  ORF Transcript_19741/g.43779 Transcript_19741/m.43779 type:complete len:458 (-) Transcript_19741:299-1672(-)
MQLSLGVSQGGGLLLNGLGVRGALGLAVGNQLLIVLLTVLLRKLGLLNLLLQIIDHHIHKANHTTRVRLLEGANLWCWGRGGKAVQTDLDKGVGLLDFLLFRKLFRLRLLVLLGVVELVQAVLGHAQQLQSSLVISSVRNVGFVFLLPLLSGICHGSVQLANPLLESNQLTLVLTDTLLACLDARVQGADLLAKLLDLILDLVNLLLAILLLVVVGGLLLLQVLDHLVDHLQDLIKVALAALQSQQDGVHLGAVHACALQQRRSLLAHLGTAGGHLNQARGRNRLLEQLQGIIRVEHLNSVGNCQQLFGPRLLHLFVVLGLLVTVSLEPRKVFLVRGQGSLGVLQVVLLLHFGNCQITGPGGLLLDSSGGSSDLGVFGSNHTILGLNRLFFVCRDLVQASLHLIGHCLQNSDDLARCRSVLLGPLEESLQSLLLAVSELGAHVRGVRQRGPNSGLQE